MASTSAKLVLLTCATLVNAQGGRPSFLGRHSPPPPGPPGSGTCVNTCLYSADGDCDDGGSGSEYSACTACTDCTDCGPRAYCTFAGPPLQSPPPGPPNSGSCLNTCRYASDGDCDDGGSGGEYSACSPCTDCEDCGPRSGCSTHPPPPPPPGPPGAGTYARHPASKRALILLAHQPSNRSSLSSRA